MKRNSGGEYIRTIAEMKSISAAAEALGISQPALSSYLKKQEQDLGTVLFDRSRQPLEPTDSGRVYLAYLEKQRLMNREMRQEISDIDNLKSGHLTVGGATFFNVAYLPVAVERFTREYPGVDLEIVDGKIPEITMKAQQGKVDLFITPIAGEDDRFEYEEFVNEKIYLAVPSQWDISRRIGGERPGGIRTLDRDGFKELCEYTFIVLKDDQHIGRKMKELFEKFEAEPVKRVTAEQTMTTLALTLKGVGVSLITESSIRNFGIKELPVLFLPDEEICRRPMFIARAAGRYLSGPAREFMRILREEYSYEMPIL